MAEHTRATSGSLQHSWLARIALFLLALPLVLGSSIPAVDPSRGDVHVHTRSGDDFIVVSDADGRYLYRRTVAGEGVHTLTDVPLSATISTVSHRGHSATSWGRPSLSIQSKSGFEPGDTLWAPRLRHHQVEVDAPVFHGVTENNVYTYVPNGPGRTLLHDRSATFDVDQLHTDGTFDAFARLVEADEVVATSHVLGVETRPSLGPQDAARTARIEWSNWNPTPGKLSLAFVNTFDTELQVDLGMLGWRGDVVFAGADPHTPLEGPLPAGQRVEVTGTYDRDFHDHVVVMASTVQPGDVAFHISYLWSPQPAPEDGEHRQVVLTPDDLPRPFKVLDWSQDTRELALDWSGVDCAGRPYDALSVRWNRSDGAYAHRLEWRLDTQPADTPRLPELDPLSERLLADVLEVAEDEPVGAYIEVAASANVQRIGGSGGQTGAPSSTACHIRVGTREADLPPYSE